MFRMPEPLPDTEPTGRELAAIEEEWPQIAAELSELDAEIRALTFGLGVDELDVRRVRRQRRRALRVPVTRVRFGAGIVAGPGLVVVDLDAPVGGEAA